MSSYPWTPRVSHNPSSLRDGTNPGSFANPPDVGGPRSFSSPDTPGMPPPSALTAWDFMPPDWRRTESGWEPPAGFRPVTQLEHARLGQITDVMRGVAQRETHLTPEQIRVEIAAGRMIIPCNVNHRQYRLVP